MTPHSYPQILVKLKSSCQEKDGKWVSTCRGEQRVTENQRIRVDIEPGEDYREIFPSQELEILVYADGSTPNTLAFINI